MAEKYQVSIYQLILGATLMHPGIDAAVVGIQNIVANTRGSKICWKNISREDYFAIRNALNVDGVGKVKDAGGTRK